MLSLSGHSQQLSLNKQRARVRNGGAALTIRRFMPVGPVPLHHFL